MTPLEEANRRLLELQAARRQQRIDEGLPHDLTLIDQGQRDDDRTAVHGIVESLPDHLGWESDMVTNALRQARQRRQTAVSSPEPNFCPTPPSAAQVSAPASTDTPQVILYPDLSAAILRRNLDAPARVYFLLRSLDVLGRGWYSAPDARLLLCGKNSPWRAISRRQLHNLLAEGEGIFWTQSNGAIWLKSPGNVAYALDVMALRGRAVSASPADFLGHVADVRAQLYAAYLTGRPHANMPIARETITAVTGVDERTQKAYELRTHIKATANFCIGERLASDNVQPQAWAHQGQGAFELKDTKGQQGAPGQSYLAWQLPNSYQTQQKPCPRGKQRRVNRELKVLLTKEAAGNSSSTENHQRRFYPNGGEAARAYNRSRDPVYWQRGAGKKVKVWHELR